MGYIFLSQLDFSGAYSLLEVIQNFKSAQTEELIVDLRYNPGGQVAFASFCALLMADIKENDVFARYRGNKNLKTIEDTFASALQRQPDGYSFAAEEVLKQGLHLKRIYMLTGPNTASAAEMLINGLKPYVEIIQVGDKTFGKDMASTTIVTPEDIRGTERAWHLIPMIYKIYNKTDQGNYNNGIIPQKVTNEFASLPLVPLGDLKDPLIQEVLQKIGMKSMLAKRPINTIEPTHMLKPKHIGSSYQAIPVVVNRPTMSEN